MNILHVDSSILGQYSVSRVLSSDIVARQLALHPGTKVVYRDLATDAALSWTHRAIIGLSVRMI